MRLAALLLLLLLPTAVCASTLYVSPTGSDANPGTQAAPLKTPQRGADALAQPGDALELAAGTYDSGLRLTLSGTAQRPIVVRGAPGPRPILRGGIALRPAQPPPAGTIAYVHIQHLELTGQGGISIQNGHALLIQDNYIHHQPDQGISGNGYRLTIDGNVIEHCGPFDDPAAVNLYHGMYVGGSQHVVTNNIWRGNLAYGVQLDGFAFDPAQQPSAAYAGAADWLIAYNVFADHPNAYGLVVWKSGATRTRIVNNIFYQNGGGVQFQNAGPGNLVTRNLFFQGSAPDVADTAGGASYTLGQNLSGVDPRFVNPAAGVYHLQAGSPALDAGVALLLARQDAHGVDRPQGAGVDLGAYESGSATPEPPRPQPPAPGTHPKMLCHGTLGAAGIIDLQCDPQP